MVGPAVDHTDARKTANPEVFMFVGRRS